MKIKHKPVVFRAADGSLITNDPVLRAHQMLGEDISEFLNDEAGVEAASARTHDDEDIDTDPYADMTGAQLKDEAKKRSVDIKGLTKVGQVRDALRAADEAEAAKAAEAENQDDSDDEED
jgi:hypothetical protein